MAVLTGPSNLSPTHFTVANDGLVSLTTPPLPAGGGTITGPVVIKTNTAPTLPAAPAGTLLQLGGPNGSPTMQWMDAFGSFNNLQFRRGNGTAIAPSALANADVIGIIGSYGWGTSAYGSTRTAIYSYATQNWTDANQGAAIAFNTTPNNSVAFAEAMRIDHSGNVGIGTTAPTNTLDVNGGANITVARFRNTNAGVGGGYIIANVADQLLLSGGSEFVGSAWVCRAASSSQIQMAGGSIAFFSNGGLTPGGTFTPTQRVVIDNNGNVGIGTAAPGSLLTVNGTCANVSGAWTTISDRSVKQDVTPYTRGLDAIVALQPVQFRFTAGSPFAEQDKPSRTLFGLIADDVKLVVPEIVGSTLIGADEEKGEEGVELSTLEPGNLIYAVINSLKTINERLLRLESATAH